MTLSMKKRNIDKLPSVTLAKSLILFQAIAFGLAQIWGIRAVIKPSISAGLMPILYFSDSSIYLSQLKSVLESRTNFPLWFVYEHLSAGTSPAANEIYVFWGLIGKTFGIRLFETYLVMTFVSGLLTFLAINSLLIVLKINLQERLILTPLVAIAGIGFGMGRPSPTQLTLWILIYAIGKAVERDIKFLPLNFFGIVLLTTNPMYAIFYLTVMILHLFWSRRITITVLLRLSPLILSVIIFSLSQRQISRQDVIERFGLVTSHLPGAVRPTILLLSTILVVNLVSRYRKIESLCSLNLLTCGLAISLNSQVITGKVFEMESHYRYAVNLILWISLLVILRKIVFEKIIYSKLIGGAIIAISVCLMIQWQNETKARLYTSNEGRLIKELQGDFYRNKVVVIGQNELSIDLYHFLPLIADIRLYWHPDLVFYDLTDSELLERFSCTVSNQFNLDDFSRKKGLIYGHRYENLKQLSVKTRYFPFLKTSNYQLLESKQITLDFDKIQQTKKLCDAGVFKYKADFVFAKRVLLNENSSPQ